MFLLIKSNKLFKTSKLHATTKLPPDTSLYHGFAKVHFAGLA